jgi:hypothetical protein
MSNTDMQLDVAQQTPSGHGCEIDLRYSQFIVVLVVETPLAPQNHAVT